MQNNFNFNNIDWGFRELPDFDVDVDGHVIKFEGNPKIRQAGIKLNLTEAYIKEIIKCSLNPIYFIRNYIYIINTDKGLIKFDMWPVQEEMVLNMHNNRFSSNLLPRQSGKTTTIGAYIIWHTIFQEAKNALIFAHKGEAAKENILRIYTMYENLPKWMQPGIINIARKSHLEFENNSRIISGTTGVGAGAGKSISLLYLDEFALVPNNRAKEFMTSTMPTISSSKESKIIVSSTPRGMNHFYEIHNSPGYSQFTVKWDDIPGRDENFKKAELERANGDLLYWAQEYECKFVGSSNTLIDPEVLVRLNHSHPIEERFNTNLKIYEKPQPNHRYMLWCDPSAGTNNDDSTIQIIDISKFPLIQCAAYKNNNIGLSQFPVLIKELALYYNNALVIIEKNGVGANVADSLYGFNGDNYEYVVGWDKTRQFKSPQKGVFTTPSVKMQGCLKLKELIENGKLILQDKDTIEQFYHFQSIGNTWKAPDGQKDDLIMALVIGTFIIQFSWIHDRIMSGLDMTEVISQSIQEIQEEVQDLWDQDFWKNLQTNPEFEDAVEFMIDVAIFKDK
jgi:hypothetical protein